MATGTVKWFSDEKGFGFITPDDGGKDLFVHHTGISGSGFHTLAEGAKVSFEAENGPKGPNAPSVQPVSPGDIGRVARRRARSPPSFEAQLRKVDEDLAGEPRWEEMSAALR